MVAIRIQRTCDEWLASVVVDPGDDDPARALAAARRAWEDLVRRRAWSPAYAARLRSAVGAWLVVTGRPDLVRALRVNHRRSPHRTVHTESSHETSFTLHDCLPRAVRSASPGGLRYRLLEHVAERLLPHLRSACRRSMQKRLLTVDKLLFGPPALVDAGDGDAEAPPATADAVAAAVRTLCRVRADRWLQRLECIYADAPHRLGTKLFRAHIRLLNALHRHVFVHPEDAPKTECIPLAPAVTTLMDDHGALSGYSSFAFSEVDDGTADDTWRLQQAVRALRVRLCKRRTRPGAAAEWTDTAFSPEEVTRILDAARTTEERLWVLLFLTTGVRLGGLCRIENRGPRASWAHELSAACLCTIEKGNAPRTLHLNEGTRLMLARWYREYDGAAAGSGSGAATATGSSGSYLFRSPRRPERCVSSSAVWRTMRGVFQRAGMRGASHAHPHTFRHTFVHMAGPVFFFPGDGAHTHTHAHGRGRR